jgi:outer membrane biosynthesis protein TonB
LPAPVGIVAEPPPPAVDAPLPKPKEQQKPTPQVTPDVSHDPPAPAPPLVTTGDARAPGRDRASADPAQESDSESDPFSKTAISAVLRDGKLDVREGRKIKTTRPHFLPGSEAAFYANPNATLVLKIQIDATGNVKHVETIRSAGSVEIDQPCEVAVYDWWFEPTHNKAGKPVPDVVVFTINFR